MESNQFTFNCQALTILGTVIKIKVENKYQTNTFLSNSTRKWDLV